MTNIPGILVAENLIKSENSILCILEMLLKYRINIYSVINSGKVNERYKSQPFLRIIFVMIFSINKRSLKKSENWLS